MTADIFSESFKAEPYWWVRTLRPQLPDSDLPQKADLLIVGSGYTGLNAALEVARAGRHVVVVDAEAAGFGCSSRNGGQVTNLIKPDFSELKSKYGEAKAHALIKEGYQSLDWLEAFIAKESIDCDFRIDGYFCGAHTPKHFEALAREADEQVPGLEMPISVVSKADQHREIGTDFYHGGVVFERHAALDPGRYHRGLLECALSAGVEVIPFCKALNIEKSGEQFLVETAKGKIQARDVLIATNGYTGNLVKMPQRRIIPIGSYMIATQELEQSLIDELFPQDRSNSDTRQVVYYYKATPDRKRVLFGGRVTGGETDPRKSAPLLYRDMIELFPQLSGRRIDHSWMGFVGYTFDHLPHLGRTDGVHYAMGYCGIGIAMGSYLGAKIGQQIVGREEGQTAFDDIGFPTRPFYQGKPWFLPAVVSYYRFWDRLGL